MIDPFELKNNENMLIKIDEFEENIKVLNELTKKYEKLKKEIKDAMLKIGKENQLDQIKWTTPKGIKITCSVGNQAIFEKKVEKEFSLNKLMEEYKDIYEKCLIEKEKEICVKKASNDRLVITLPKEEC